MSTAVILMNLGTPLEPTAPAVRKFLRDFLSDSRVVEIPRPLWLPILHGFILPLRPRRIAPAYAQIWDSSVDGEPVEGSPLLYYTRRQAELLQARLAEERPDITVSHAVTYGEPGLQTVIERLRREGFVSFIVFPLYPQYSATTTGPIYDQVAHIFRRNRDIPDIRVIRDYYRHPLYIRALANSVREHWEKRGAAEKLLLSFHGIPKANIRKGDPYYQQCQETAEHLAAELGLEDDRWQFSFQSRFGKAEWLQPYTDRTLMEWGKSGVTSVDVICPAFSADCLETLEEISVENRANFLQAGGKAYHYIPALNLRGDHIEALAAIVQEQLPNSCSSA
ncbi:ferrochelatase [Microbulbifer thermotolerans]|uniref:Ferrochelatase n=1 Tax=Microbulbifer thermotolerans TaxID=252514 RepID=A0A143HKN3_MICTH|nr:ferrochelatase [Microbulbifer thermotolerans]AMX02279.1 ferrochelatase [Microbulbifer thermotolerans]MCX2778736.1 ferrochelatase [Microbulbifer thermotolerans]MCX2793622.1 ferrochelatase [Microbulbifer thermotolerans]MCX2804041.1 ferrochelatase [Microbulbifer thermotolerans]MCX2832896.1 ferrochelatase [Microbulbifer thermotolerans]